MRWYPAGAEADPDRLRSRRRAAADQRPASSRVIERAGQLGGGAQPGPQRRRDPQGDRGHPVLPVVQRGRRQPVRGPAARPSCRPRSAQPATGPLVPGAPRAIAALRGIPAATPPTGTSRPASSSACSSRPRTGASPEKLDSARPRCPPAAGPWPGTANMLQRLTAGARSPRERPQPSSQPRGQAYSHPGAPGRGDRAIGPGQQPDVEQRPGRRGALHPGRAGRQAACQPAPLGGIGGPGRRGAGPAGSGRMPSGARGSAAMPADPQRRDHRRPGRLRRPCPARPR